MTAITRVLVLSLIVSAVTACGGGDDFAAVVPALGQPPTAVLVVTNHDDDGPGSLRQAIAAAPPGAWITFDTALGLGAVVLESPLVITKVLTIGGLGGAGGRHLIHGQFIHQIFFVDGGALQLNDLRIEAGSAVEGGAIEARNAHVVCWRVAFALSSVTLNGGCIFSEDGVLEVYDSLFLGNFADVDGGAITARDSSTRIERTSFSANGCNELGGALRMTGGTATIVNSAFHHCVTNAFMSYGGAIAVSSHGGSTPALLRIFNSTITENNAGEVGGGIYVRPLGGNTVDLEMQRTILAQNTAGAGDPDVAYSGAGYVVTGSYNLIGEGSGEFVHGVDNNLVGSNAVPIDPMLLAPIILPDGRRVSLPLPASPAVDAVPPGMNPNPEGFPMVVDLRFLPRDPGLPSDIGAIEN